jgi:hypothetical protein
VINSVNMHVLKSQLVATRGRINLMGKLVHRETTGEDGSGLDNQQNLFGSQARVETIPAK